MCTSLVCITTLDLIHLVIENLYKIDIKDLFQLIFIVRSYVVLINHCARFGEGLDPANMFNPATLCMYVPVQSQEPVIQWLSFVYMWQICFSFILFFLLIIEGRMVTYSCSFLCHFGLLWRVFSLAIIPYLLFIYVCNCTACMYRHLKFSVFSHFIFLNITFLLLMIWEHVYINIDFFFNWIQLNYPFWNLLILSCVNSIQRGHLPNAIAC